MPSDPPVHEPASDATLVARIRNGETAVWAEVFDRHRESVWAVAISVTRRSADAEDAVQNTFLGAVERIDQLRDPERLRAWLCSIARSRAIDTVRGRRETPASSQMDWLEPVADEPDPDTGLRRTEVVGFVVDALDGLDERDRTVLELAERQQMTGDELAEALDVRRDHAYTLLHNARDRFERSVASLVVSRGGRDDCTELQRLLGDWSGTLDPTIRKRVARHIDDCDTCEATKRRMVRPHALLAALPVLALPQLLRQPQAAAAIVERATALAGTTPVAAGAGAAGTGTGGGASGAAGTGAATGAAGAGAGSGATMSGLTLAVSAVVLAAVIGGGALLFTGGGGDPSTDAPATPTTTPTTEGAPTTTTASTDTTTTETPAPADTAATTTAPPATTIPLSPLPPAVAELADTLGSYCGVAGEWYDGATPGPTGIDPASIEAYFDRTNTYVQQLAVFDTPVAATWATYAAAYQEFRDDLAASGWAWPPVSGVDPAGLNTAEQALTAHLSDTCGLTTLGSPAVNGAYVDCWQRAAWLTVLLAESGLDAGPHTDALTGIAAAYADGSVPVDDLTDQLLDLIADAEALFGTSVGAPGDPGFDGCGPA